MGGVDVGRSDIDDPTRVRVQRALEQSARLNPKYFSTFAYLAEVKSRLESAESALPIAAQAVALAPSARAPA